MTEVALIDEHISGFKTSMEKLQMRLDEIKKEEETINQALKKYEGALEYANILRSQLPEKVVMNDVKGPAPALPTIPETKAEEEVKGKCRLTECSCERRYGRSETRCGRWCCCTRDCCDIIWYFKEKEKESLIYL